MQPPPQPPWQPYPRPRPRSWPAVALTLGLIGLAVCGFFAVGFYNAHTTCSSGLGELAQGLDQKSANDCATVNALFALSLLGLLGSVGSIIAAIIGYSTDPAKRTVIVVQQPPPAPWDPPRGPVGY